jgi:uncharacterized protein involved in exopolysaccharide biosynthesis
VQTDLRAQRDNLEQVSETRQRTLGCDHPDLANDLRELAGCYMNFAA